jgi:HEPN domain-containing protein
MSEVHAGWLRQAQRDLEHAARSLEDGDYEWACFAAQQSAEKAVKAVFIRANVIAWGHSVSALLQRLPAPWVASPQLIDAARELDRHYIPARYPNAHPEGAPYEYYTRDAAARAVGHTRDILAFCEGVLAGHPERDEPTSPGSTAVGAESSGD